MSKVEQIALGFKRALPRLAAQLESAPLGTEILASFEPRDGTVVVIHATRMTAIEHRDLYREYSDGTIELRRYSLSKRQSMRDEFSNLKFQEIAQTEEATP